MSKYIGHLLNDLRDGFGKYFSPEDVSYKGEWKGRLKEGYRKMKCEIYILRRISFKKK